MALVHSLRERVGDPGPNAHARGLLDPELGGDPVGRLEADALDVTREPVGVLGDDLHGPCAIDLVDPHGPAGADAMAVQEEHDLADDLLFGPAVLDPLR